MLKTQVYTNKKMNVAKRVIKKKKSNKKKNGLNTMSPFRTVDEITRQLASSSISPAKQVKPYVACRLNPFMSGKATSGIPDGKNSQYVVVDAYSVDTLTQLPSTFVLQTVSAMPSMLWMNSVTGPFVVNGTVYNAASALTPTATSLTTSWAQLAIIPNFNGLLSAGNGSGSEDPWNASSARFVTIGYRIIYTGPVNTCSGSISVVPNKVSIKESSGTTTTNVLATGTNTSLVIPQANTTVASYLNTGVGYANVDFDCSSAIITKNSLTVRPEQGLVIIPRPGKGSFDKKPLFTNRPQFLVGNFTTQAAPNTLASLLRQGTVNVIPSGCVVFVENDFENFMIQFNGINSDASYRIETVVCIEVNPQVTSILNQVAIKASPNDQAALSQADLLTTQNPSANPYSGRQPR